MIYWRILYKKLYKIFKKYIFINNLYFFIFFFSCLREILVRIFTYLRGKTQIKKSNIDGFFFNPLPSPSESVLAPSNNSPPPLVRSNIEIY